MQKIYAILTALFLMLPTAAMADIISTIEVSSVQEREIYGGLGNNTGPIGSVTEFTAPEHPYPFLTIGGAHAVRFNANHIYVVRNGGQMFLCADASAATNSCVPCGECKDVQDKLVALDVSKTLGLYQIIRAQYTFSAISRSGARVEMHKPAASGPTPFVTATIPPKSPPGITDRFSRTAFLFKADRQKDYHLCPERRYDPYACLICDDCAEKGNLFEPLQ